MSLMFYKLGDPKAGDIRELPVSLMYKSEATKYWSNVIDTLKNATLQIHYQNSAWERPQQKVGNAILNGVDILNNVLVDLNQNYYEREFTYVFYMFPSYYDVDGSLYAIYDCGKLSKIFQELK